MRQLRLQSLIRGDSKYYLFRFRRPNGAVVDISGWAIFYTLKRYPTDSDDKAVVKMQLTSHSKPLQGESLLVIPVSITDSLTPGVRYYCDFQVVPRPGIVISIPPTRVGVLADISRRTA